MNYSENDDDFTMCFIELETGSSASIFGDQKMLKDIGHTSRLLKLEANGGRIAANEIRTHHDMKVWLSDKSIANILSLQQVIKKHRVAMDTKQDNIIKIEIKDSAWVKFVLNEVGLCVHDIRSNDDNE